MQLTRSFSFVSTASPVTERGEECVERAPAWVPDNDAPRCMACQAGFTVVRRRHHCRNCGKVFCGRCSSNNVPLPRYGHTKPVRVCNRCFLYQVTPFTTVSQVTSTSWIFLEWLANPIIFSIWNPRVCYIFPFDVCNVFAQICNRFSIVIKSLFLYNRNDNSKEFSYN